MSVETIIAHPLYDGQRLLYDYAILRTKELIPFSKTVNAACLPQFTMSEVTDSKNLQISGWGKEGGCHQGCISCGILVSGIRARGVSSEHMENMEMFSCSPT